MTVLTKAIRVLPCVVQVGCDVSVRTGSLLGFFWGKGDGGSRSTRAATPQGSPDPHRASIESNATETYAEAPGIESQPAATSAEATTKTKTYSHFKISFIVRLMRSMYQISPPVSSEDFGTV